jgi:uncharacterized protein
MKKLIIFCAAFLLLTVATAAQNSAAARHNPKQEEKVRQYWFVMLLRGANREQDSLTASKIQAEHMDNINRLYNEGKLKVAGPFGDNGEWLGIFIFDSPTKKEVIDLLQSDPAIQAGRLTYDIRPWWTSPTGSFAPGKPEKQSN